MSHEVSHWRSAAETAERVPASTPILAIDRLCKRYGATIAVDGISFRVGHNEIVGLVGPNGAGKTTTINMILGVLAPTSGSICINGADIAARRSQALHTPISLRCTRRCQAISPSIKICASSASFTA